MTSPAIGPGVAAEPGWIEGDADVELPRRQLGQVEKPSRHHPQPPPPGSGPRSTPCLNRHCRRPRPAGSGTH
jgi:hypothetical protein